MIVGVLRLDVRLHAASNLKQKRSQIKRLLGRIRSEYPVSAAEVGHQDLLQRSLVGVALVSTSEQLISGVFGRIEEQIEMTGMNIIATDLEYSHYGDDVH